MKSMKGTGQSRLTMNRLKEDKVKLEVKTVLFVANTDGGKLAKSMREVMGRLEKILGFRIKVAEKT